MADEDKEKAEKLAAARKKARAYNAVICHLFSNISLVRATEEAES
jgi:hypothetical protein